MQQLHTVLIIDDEPFNVELLRDDLECEGYRVLTAFDGVQGWELLQQHKEQIDSILLDRMMPNMNGMELLEKIKADETVASIPVIMQTAAAQKQQVIEGVRAGVYYYLTKPYDHKVMLSVVQAAIDDYACYIQLRQELTRFKDKLRLIEVVQFSCRTLDEASYIASFLSNLFPEPERVILGISELLINAIEHGNLEISYNDKSELNHQGIWRDEVVHRLTLDKYQDRTVQVNCTRNREQIVLKIQDQGKGFDWQQYMEITPERALDNHGRGIALANLISFDRLEYQGNGNQVVCTVLLAES